MISELKIFIHCAVTILMHFANTPGQTFGLVWFVLFNDIWSQQGHSMSCMTIFFINKCKLAEQTSGYI